MSSVEKVLEWVNSSEAKAAKYEQEAKVEISGWIITETFNVCEVKISVLMLSFCVCSKNCQLRLQ